MQNLHDQIMWTPQKPPTHCDVDADVTDSANDKPSTVTHAAADNTISCSVYSSIYSSPSASDVAKYKTQLDYVMSTTAFLGSLIRWTYSSSDFVGVRSPQRWRRTGEGAEGSEHPIPQATNGRTHEIRANQSFRNK